MKIRAIRSVANSICQMCCSARIDSSLEMLAGVSDDTVEIDILAGSCKHPSAGTLDLPVIKDFSTWLSERLEKFDVPLNVIQKVLLSLRFKTDRVPTDRSRILLFDLECTSTIVAQDRVFSGKASNAIWYRRLNP